MEKLNDFSCDIKIFIYQYTYVIIEITPQGAREAQSNFPE